MNRSLMHVLLFIFLFLSFQEVAAIKSPDFYLQTGYSFIEKGKPEEALKLWEEAVNELDIPSLVIATEYLRTATDYQLEDYYPSASKMYQWSLSASDRFTFNANKKELEQEILRLAPIFSAHELAEFQNLFEETMRNC